MAEVKAHSPYLNDDDTREIALGLLATIDAESGGDPKRVGDAGHSIGLFQMHDQGAGYGMSVAERENPDVQFAHGQKIIESLERLRYWANRGNVAWTPRSISLAIKEVQRCADGFEVGYANAYTRLKRLVPA